MDVKVDTFTMQRSYLPTWNVMYSEILHVLRSDFVVLLERIRSKIENPSSYLERIMDISDITKQILLIVILGKKR